jgi:thymidylate synthase
MKTLKSYSLGKLHELAVEYVLKHGKEIITENGEKTLECESLCLTTSTPWEIPMISEKSSLNENFAEEYMRKLIEGYDKKTGFTYDYHGRLFNYRGLINQIDNYIIPKLAKEPESRRALAITWDPTTDETMNDCPCLQLLLFTIRDSKLDAKAIFRSNDMLLAAGQNMYGLVGLQSYVAEKISNIIGKEIGIGAYEHISLIPHIYYIRDAEEIKKFKK